MATTRKSAKRSAKKRPAAKGKSARTKAARKSSSTRSKKSGTLKATRLKRQARKGLKAARGGVSTVLRAGGKTWRTLKSTTAQVVDGVKETLARERRSARPGKSR